VQQQDTMGTFNNQRLRASSLRAARSHKAIDVTTENSHDDARIERMRSLIVKGMILLGISIAMYLAAAGIVHVLTSPDAVATIVPEGSMAPASLATASKPAAGADHWPWRQQ
jgi:cysteine synthase